MTSFVPSDTRWIRTTDPEWPRQIDELGGMRPPRRLRIAGRPIPTIDRCIGIVGTRRPTVAGAQATELFARCLSEAGFTIVSGFAMGIDALAHRAANRAGGHTVAVLGCGLGIDYPKRNSSLRRELVRTGTLLSEYDDGVEPAPFRFPDRNRLIAGLCCAVLVVEGRERSGSLITARHALDANRTVFAVPGSFRNPSAAVPNELIRTSRAVPVTEVDHILEELSSTITWGAPLITPANHPEPSEEEQALLFALDDVAAPVERLAEVSGLDPIEAGRGLSRMEAHGLCRRTGNGYAIDDRGTRVRAALGAADPGR